MLTLSLCPCDLIELIGLDGFLFDAVSGVFAVDLMSLTTQLKKEENNHLNWNIRDWIYLWKPLL